MHPNNKQICFCLFLGSEHRKERMGVMDVFRQIHEAKPDARPLHFSISSWGAVDYRYFSEVMGGARILLRTLPDSVRKTEFRRKALASPGGNSRQCG